jgi:hypothetical protein
MAAHLANLPLVLTPARSIRPLGAQAEGVYRAWWFYGRPSEEAVRA